MNHCAIVGFGCAGYHAAKAMRQSGYSGCIDVYQSPAAPPANPMLTTYYVSGKLSHEGLFPFGPMDAIVRELDLVMHTTGPVTQVNYYSTTLKTGDNAIHVWDKLLLATGAEALVPPFPGHDLPGVHTMRTVADAEALKARLDVGGVRKVVVIGASMVGIKVAQLVRERDIACTLADMAPIIFPVAALPETAAIIEKRVTSHGIGLKFGHGITAVERAGNGLRVSYSTGGTEDCDLVMLCIGTRAATALAGDVLRVNRGIVVDERMQTSRMDVYAAGDCCEGANLQSGDTQIIGLWANAGLQGRCAGLNMAGLDAVYHGNVPHNITHFFDTDFISFGDVRAEGECHSWASADGKTILNWVEQGGRITCLNLLDNYRISGVLKAHFLKQLTGDGGPIDNTGRARMAAAGVPAALANQLSKTDFADERGR